MLNIKSNVVKRGFTLIEIILVFAIMAIVVGAIVSSLNIKDTIAGTLETKTDAELYQMHNAAFLYYADHGNWPADVGRGLPNGLEAYLGPGEWQNAPFNDVAEYDWDNFVGSNGRQVLQVSVRFCPLGDPGSCDFPNAEWADGFDEDSSYYWCIQGLCRAHPNQPDDHPGYCANCGG